MEDILDHNKPHQRYFEEMSRIPHGSGNEKAYSDYLALWAKDHSLSYKQDEVGNVIIYKSASAGYEDHDPVILQGHMDMVCVKAKGSTHDFTKDPIDMYIEGGWLRAKDTTLGADDGVGCAYMLAILEDNELKHPALECVFTVSEETTCAGAANLKSEDFQAHRMLGLDDIGGGTTYVTSAGDYTTVYSRKASWEEKKCAAYELYIHGLMSGHSGVDIDKERGNAIKIAAHTLFALIQSGADVRLAGADMGAAVNAIPAEGTITFAADLDEDAVKTHVERWHQIFLSQLQWSDNEFDMDVAACETSRVISRQDSADIISFLRFLPDGFRHKNMHFSGLTTASSNIGLLKIENGNIDIETLSRSSIDSYMDMMEEEQAMLCGVYHMDRDVVSRVPGFAYIENSKIRQTVDECLHEVTGRHIEELFVHGGLEAGYIFNLKPGMDIATIGPLAPDEHTVRESLNLRSFDEIFEVIKKVLERL